MDRQGPPGRHLQQTDRYEVDHDDAMAHKPGCWCSECAVKATFTVVHPFVYFVYSKGGESSCYSSFFTLTITTVDSDDSRHAVFRE